MIELFLKNNNKIVSKEQLLNCSFKNDDNIVL